MKDIVSIKEEFLKLINDANDKLLFLQKSIKDIDNSSDCTEQEPSIDEYLAGKYLIGAILIDNSSINKDVAMLQGIYDFHLPTDSAIFDMIRKLYKQNQIINPTTVAEEFKKYMIELIKETPNSPDIELYFEIIRRESNLAF